MRQDLQISSFSILIIFTVLSVIGLSLISQLDLQYLPSAQAPSISVNYSWVGASPEVLEREVTAPLEAAFNLIEGVQKIYSVSNSNSAYITLDIRKDVDMDFIRFEVASRIRQLYPQLPTTVTYPQVYVNQPEEQEKERPVMIWSLNGEDLASELFRYALEGLSPKLAIIDGLQNIEVSGGNLLEWRIEYDKYLLDNIDISLLQIKQALQEHFDTKALGITQDSDQSFYINLKNWSANADEYLQTTQWKNIVIQKNNRRIIRLGDVAQVSLQERPPTRHYRINGLNSVRLLFYAEANVNSIHLAKAIKKSILESSQQLPPTYQLFLEDDATEYLEVELEKIKNRSLLSLGILLLFVLLIYRSVRQLLVIAFALVANLGIASIFYYLLEVELHLYALAGITVSLGIIIDNALVMAHHLRTQGNLKVFPALLAATLTTISALILIYFLPDLWRSNLLNFAKVIIINLGVSLLVALLLIPALLRYTVHDTQYTETKIPNHKAKRLIAKFNQAYAKLLSFLLHFRKTTILLVILAFGLPVFWLPNKVQDWNWYNTTLGNDWYVEEVKPWVNRIFGGSLRLFVWYVYEGSGYRQKYETILNVEASMPQGATLQQMNEIYEQIENYLLQFPREIKKFTTSVSSGQHGRTQVFFNEGYDVSFPYVLRSRMIARSVNMGGVQWNIYGVGEGFNNSSGSTPSYRLVMYGYNKEALKKQADIFADKLDNHPRIKTVNTEANINWWQKDRYEYEMALDKQRMAEQQIPPNALTPLFAAFNLDVNPDFYTPRGTSVRLIDNRLHPNERTRATNDLWRLQNEQFAIDSFQIKLDELGTFEKKKVASSIHKENQQYLRMLEWEYTGSPRFGNKYLEEVSDEMEKLLPMGYTFERQSFSFFNKDQQLQYALFGLVIGLIFFICAIMFESLRQAFAIILLIPTSFIGIFLTFYWFDLSFDQGGYISFVLLSGLVVNSMILIINDYNGFRQTFPRRAALSLYLKAFNHKIVPILLTILSTALGLLPFLLAGDQEVFWFALAAGAIGGLVFSLVVIFIFIPLFVIKLKK